MVLVEQLSALLDFMESQPELAHGHCSRSLEGRTLAKRRWVECAKILNSVAADCPNKSPTEWRSFYNEFKSKLMRKIKLQKSEMSATGGGSAKKLILTPLQERLYNIIGPDIGEPLAGLRHNPLSVWRDFKVRAYNKGANMEQEIIQTGDRDTTLSKLEEKDTYIYPDATPTKDPKKKKLEDDDNPVSQFCDFQLIVTETDEEDSVEVVQTTSSDSVGPEELIEEAPSYNRIPYNTHLQPPGPPRARRTTKIASPSPASKATETPVSELNLNRRQSNSEERDSIRKDLLTILTSNAESMQMLAAAAQGQAEASKMHSEVAKLQAETTLVLAQAINKTGDTLVNLINKS